MILNRILYKSDGGCIGGQRLYGNNRERADEIKNLGEEVGKG